MRQIQAYHCIKSSNSMNSNAFILLIYEKIYLFLYYKNSKDG